MTALPPKPDALRSFETASGLVSELSWLVSPPAVCTKVTELAHSQRTAARDFEKVINRDPNLTARLLKLANSSYFGYAARVDTVARAVTVIGLRELKHLVLAVSAVKTFSKIDNRIVNVNTFWAHSIYCAVIAQELAKLCHVLHPERLFVAGLLHDVGSLLLYHRVPEVSRQLLLMAEGDEEALHARELEELGFSHADLGGLLMELWNFPEQLQQIVRFHHQPSLVDESRPEACIVHFANILANTSGLGGFCEAPAESARVDPVVWDALPIDEGDVQAGPILEQARARYLEMVQVFSLCGS
ncbi:MAG: HDOD domain-containing protein [Gammaproteobacteria bacterium]|nr:HDOD domain-containing protein [Gammaproteobacteria bacterium]